MDSLTPTEEKIMQVIWDLEQCVVKEIIDQLLPPPPPYSTISSVVRILEKKGFVGHKAYGRTYQYYPLISKETYRKFSFRKMMSAYFDGSYQQMVSFLVKEESIDKEEFQHLLDLIDEDEHRKNSPS
ncbi:MAG: BlaI/MecI/CopY family transcriptional regulator [Bacteroidota bacterium]